MINRENEGSGEGRYRERKAWRKKEGGEGEAGREEGVGKRKSRKGSRMAWRLDGTASQLHRGEADSAGQVMSLLCTFIFYSRLSTHSLHTLCCLLRLVLACPLLSVDLAMFAGIHLLLPSDPTTSGPTSQTPCDRSGCSRDGFLYGPSCLSVSVYRVD